MPVTFRGTPVSPSRPGTFRGPGGVQVNQAINARYEGDALVFDRDQLFVATTGKTHDQSTSPKTPGYRQAISPMPGSPRWKGVEYLSIDSSRRLELLHPVLGHPRQRGRGLLWPAGSPSRACRTSDDPANTQAFPWFTVAAGGNDPFQAANIEPLQGKAPPMTATRPAFYASKITTPALRYFNADVRLTADFDNRQISSGSRDRGQRHGHQRADLQGTED